jgi:hypothetical protein
MSTDAVHWRAFNISCRLVGVAFLLAGLMFSISALLATATDPVPSPVTVAQSHSPVVAVIVGLIVAVLGGLLLIVRPFRPDLGETSVLVEPFVARRQQRIGRARSWWTGETKPERHSAAI